MYEGKDYIFLINGLDGSVRGQRPLGWGVLGNIGNYFSGKKK